MKAIRRHSYVIPGYGVIRFISCPPSFKVFWQCAGEKDSVRIAWLKPGLRPNAELAVFYCRVACAREDGLNEYYYADNKQDPPERKGDAIEFVARPAVSL